MELFVSFSFASKVGVYCRISVFMVSKDMEYKILMVLTICLMIMGACEIAVFVHFSLSSIVVQSVGKSRQSITSHDSENSKRATVSEFHSLSRWVINICSEIYT